MNRGFIVVISIAILIATVTPSTGQTSDNQSVSPLSGGWLYVGGSGPGNYSLIQDAIDNASTGDTIFVFNGIYYENPRINTSGITLTGESQNTTIIDGARKDVVVQTSGNDTTIQGFTIQNSSTGMFNDIGLVVNNRGHPLGKIQVSHCTFQKNGRGIYFYNVSDSSITYCRIQHQTAQSIELYCTTNNITIQHCTILDCGTDMGGAAYPGGISHIGLYNFSATGITIKDNTLTDIGATGIQLDTTRNVVISNNTIHDCSWWGITVGISQNITISRNRISDCTKNGIMTSTCDITIADNGISGCGNGEIFDGGVLIQDSQRNAVIQGNNIADNDPHGLYLIRAPDSTITNNNIINNTKDAFVFDTPTSRWHGNYWSDWRGIGPMVIKGWLSKWQLPWANLDRRPAKQPYTIPELN
jgi:parallel beta-helix repeat protein